jgi:predicted ATPase
MGNPISSELKFSFSTTLKNADDEHKVDFDFNRKSDIPRRIFGIVGKNATGKTIFLSNLANALGYTKQRKNEVINKYETGVFDTELGPPFSKVICVSYSLFDNFKRPKPSKRFSYIYCGIRNEQDEIDRSELRKRHVESLKTINKKDRANFWIESLSSLVDLRTLGYKYDEEYAWNGIENISDFEKPNMLNLSSGQSMLLYALTEVIANITENSLILFDEPETHLHPNAIANLINVINAIAEKYNSFGIISTHSPLVVREIPSKNVYIFERDGNTPITRPLDIESYGENLTVITNHIFETTEVKEGYKKTLKKLSKSFKYEEILELFDNELSLNARIFLSGLYDDK